MTNENMADVAVEVSCILERFPASYMKKIPQDFIDFINSIKSNTYTFSYDENKSLNEQNIKTETKGVIAYIYENFCCSDEEKKQYQKWCREVEQEQEEKARIKYNVDNLFKNTKQAKNITATYNKNDVFNKSNTNEYLKEESVEIVENKKEKWYRKIINKIFSFFKHK